MENLKRIREPLAWVLIGLLALVALLLSVQLAWSLVESEGGLFASYNWLFVVQSSDETLVLAVVAAVAGCAARPAVARARAIALIAALVATLSFVLPLVFGVLSMMRWLPETEMLLAEPTWWLTLTMLYPPAQTGLVLIAAIVLWVLAAKPRVRSGEATSDEAASEDQESEADDDPAAGPELENPSVWQPSEATGAVWRTADEAAAGAPGARFLEPSPEDPADSEWAHEAPAPKPQPNQDWRPPAGL